MRLKQLLIGSFTVDDNQHLNQIYRTTEGILVISACFSTSLSCYSTTTKRLHLSFNIAAGASSCSCSFQSEPFHPVGAVSAAAAEVADQTNTT